MNAPTKPKAAQSVGEIIDEMDAGAVNNLAKLREPFPPHLISKLPKETRKQIDERKAGNNIEWNCAVCGGMHHKNAVHLDYVGHAALTDRLLDTDIQWSWEPVGFTAEGLPALDRNGGLWIKLTVCGVTRYGYGAADGKSGGDAMKEMIGDALRNAAMRFGAALDLWHKGDLHPDNDDTPEPIISTGEPKKRAPVKLDGPYTCPTQLMTAAREFVRTLNGMSDYAEYLAWAKTKDVRDFIAQLKRDMPDWWFGGPTVPADFVPLEILAGQKERDLQQLDEAKTKAEA